MDKEIVIIKPGTLSVKDKEKLTKSGRLVIEHSNPDTVIFRKSTSDFEYTSKLVFTNCYACGERIYLTQERLTALKESKKVFFCSHGHSQSYK